MHFPTLGNWILVLFFSKYRLAKGMRPADEEKNTITHNIGF